MNPVGEGSLLEGEEEDGVRRGSQCHKGHRRSMRENQDNERTISQEPAGTTVMKDRSAERTASRKSLVSPRPQHRGLQEEGAQKWPMGVWLPGEDGVKMRRTEPVSPTPTVGAPLSASLAATALASKFCL